MKDNSKEPKLTYALDSSDKMVHIGSVERGLSCNCRCPKCNEFLVAKLGHEGGRQAHFAHRKGSDCHGSYMSALHKLAEQIIEEEMAVMVPAYKEIDKQKLEFEKVEVEQRVERKDLQPDVVGVTSDGLRWFIEIRNTHEVDETKRTKLIESNITCLEIDVREQTLENLKSFLLESTESREWINNPNYESQIAEAKRNKVSQVERLILESKELTIPIYADTGTQIIDVKEVTSVSKIDDGIYARLKVISLDDVSYVFEIGSHDVIETTNDSFRHDCNELRIYIDNLSPDSVITLDTLDIKWSYHFATEKERETRIKEYKSNPQYEVRPKADCYSKCKYRPFGGKCIYLVKTILCHGENYVVCKYKNTMPSQSVTKRDESVVRSRCNLSHGTLPFDRYWTIGEVYAQLQSTRFCEVEKGLLVEIVKCDRTDNGILLICKDSRKVSALYPFHIATINVCDGKYIRKKVADFTNLKAAQDSYYTRLKAMRDRTYLKWPEEVDGGELPF